MRGQLRFPSEHVRSDNMVMCLVAPPAYTTPDNKAFLQVTERRYFYFSGAGDVTEVSYDDIDELVLVHKQFNGRFVDIKMKSGEPWRFSVLPQTARIMRRWFNKGDAIHRITSLHPLEKPDQGCPSTPGTGPSFHDRLGAWRRPFSSPGTRTYLPSPLPSVRDSRQQLVAAVPQPSALWRASARRAARSFLTGFSFKQTTKTSACLPPTGEAKRGDCSSRSLPGRFGPRSVATPARFC